MAIDLLGRFGIAFGSQCCEFQMKVTLSKGGDSRDSVIGWFNKILFIPTIFSSVPDRSLKESALAVLHVT